MHIHNMAEKEKETNDTQLLDKMLKTRSILLVGEINKDLAEKVIRNLLLLEVENKNDPIKIFIDSPGGDMHAGYSMFDMMRFVHPPIYTIGMGLIASAGAQIFLAAPKENRYAFVHSQYLIHQPLAGSAIRGVATDLEIQAKEFERARRQINELISIETGQNIEKIDADTDRDFWMSAQEACDYGLASRIIYSRDDLP